MTPASPLNSSFTVYSYLLTYLLKVLTNNIFYVNITVANFEPKKITVIKIAYKYDGLHVNV